MRFADWPKIIHPDHWKPIPRIAFLVAGDAGGKKFHMMDCEWAGWITHPLYFLEPDRAAAKNFRPCRTCRPRERHPIVIQSIPLQVFEEAFAHWQEREKRMELTQSLASVTQMITVQFSHGLVETFQIVPDGERKSADQISLTSPLGASIIHAKEGQIVRYKTPRGEEEVMILEVRQLPASTR